MLQTIIDWAAATPMNPWVLDWNWTWAILETLHFIGLCMLLGSLLVIDLRLAGFFKQIPVAATHKLVGGGFIGFGINLTTGILFFFGDPGRYTLNIGFQIKFFLIILAGLNALWFFLALDKELQQWEPHGDTPGKAKLIGWASLTLWFSVLMCGRLIPYVGTG